MATIMFDEKTLPDALKPVAKLVEAGRCSVPVNTVECLASESLKNFVLLTKAEAKNVSIFRPPQRGLAQITSSSAD
jgi:hypothetical protein